MSEYLLEVKGVKMHFPIHGGILYRQIATVYAVDGVSFNVKPGETVGVVGESGCAKSTLGKTILRLYDPTAGKVLFQGKNLADMATSELRKARKDIGFIFQDPYESLNQTHTVGNNLDSSKVYLSSNLNIRIDSIMINVISIRPMLISNIFILRSIIIFKLPHFIRFPSK